MKHAINHISTTAKKAAQILRDGKIIAYPTEAVYGLGCDPFNKEAVMELLKLKKREVKKGLLLIAANWKSIKNLVDETKLSKKTLQKVLATWPGPITWILPASSKAPSWIKGKHNSVALRITSHPTARAICQAFGKAIVSTSANIAENPPCRTKQQLLQEFKNKIGQNKIIESIVKGRVGKLTKPTPIYDAITNKAVRK